MFHRRRVGMTGLLLVACALCAANAWAEITIQTVPVGNVGNAADAATGYGSVNYAYNIGKYEVTAGQYTAFLNAVGATDTYALYNLTMWATTDGCKIQRSGSSGSYTYSVAIGYANRPVNYVSFGDAMRFTNWLHNGQPTGAQNADTTEDGAYSLNGAVTDAALNAVVRNGNGKWAVASENEWYKAAYYNPATASYYLYPTSSNAVPGRDLADVSGNNANYDGTPRPIQSPYYTTLVGQFQNSESPYGTFDQGGNLFEMTEAAGRRGGSYFNITVNMRSDSRASGSPTAGGGTIGFRVSQVPEPGSVGLLTLGLSGMLVRRRDGGR